MGLQSVDVWAALISAMAKARAPIHCKQDLIDIL